MRLTILFTIAFLVINLSLYSQTDKMIEISSVLKELNLKKDDIYDIFVVKKVIPYSPDKSIVVIPSIKEKQEGYFLFDAYILIIDNDNEKILYKFYEPNVWTSDAVSIEKIDVDFAPYILNSENRAFGIRVLYEGSSRPNPYENEDISLYITKNDSIIRVLKNFSVKSTNGEWDTNCEGEFLYEQKILIISNKSTNGFNDIIVKNKSRRNISRKVGDDCKDEETVRNTTTVLHYDGKEYK